MATVLITGGTGMIGSAVSKALLRKNYDVIILSRNLQGKKPAPDSYRVRKPEIRKSEPGSYRVGNLSYAQWNIRDQSIDKDSVSRANYIIHLAGAGVADKRWTKKRKQEIADSRVKSGELIVKTLTENHNNVKAIISSSGIGWYGADPAIPNPRPFSETDPAASDFLGQTCKAWQESLEPVRNLNKRLVIFRTGIVLSSEDGALKEFMRPLQFGAAAILGNGKQIVSWIHIDDLVNLYIKAIEGEGMVGVYNAVSPLPVSNKELTLQLAKSKGQNFFIPVHIPSILLKLVLGEMSTEVLKSATVSCKKIQDMGFTFLYPSIGEALKDLLKK